MQEGDLAVVEFTRGGIARVVASELNSLDPSEERISQGRLDAPLPTAARLLGFAIQSVQQKWGVFSRSRIQLLPHQIWVCRKVLDVWPPRWLVADDVGLGKTIEAGLVLKALQARKKLNRFLILCPASLVAQWQSRLHGMFAIGTTIYRGEDDRPGTGYWGVQRQVVASLHTLRNDEGGRHNRLLEADAWDVVIVDEAHHLGDKPRESTLAFDLVGKMNNAGKIKGLLLFSGTPHKGVDYSFLSLMRLLRPDLFNPEQPLQSQLQSLPEALIRNSKAKARDLQGGRLFFGSTLQDHTFSYSQAEQAFYDRLTAFIQEGLLYGQSLGEAEGRAVGLVLITFQKLAASSVAAVSRTLQRRLDALQNDQERRRQLEFAEKTLRDHPDLKENEDLQGQLDELAAEINLLERRITLIQNEAPFLEELIRLAAQVQEETKLRCILELVQAAESEGGLEGRSVLFFTEYKATQSLLIGMLRERFGPTSTGFINGDGVARGVPAGNGQVMNLTETREAAAEAFNQGRYRFLVSTEAAGEGIDLQARCHTLIHVDMPWNPMRMHQRVGRLYRYGQKKTVEVHTFRNPGTVESRIHDLLKGKLQRISQAFAAAAEEAEDLLQIVLGVVQPGFYEELARLVAAHADEGTVQAWVDQGFGGDGVVNSVQNLLGHVAQFDFQGVGDGLPKVDLPDLKPFFKGTLALYGREWMDDAEGRGSFLTPEAWLGPYGIRERYAGMVFEREGAPLHNTLGADFDLFQIAMGHVLGRSENAACLARRHWNHPPLLVFRIHEQVAVETAGPDVVIGLLVRGESFEVLRDWELIKFLSPVLDAARSVRQTEPGPPSIPPAGFVESALAHLKTHSVLTDIGFPRPGIECLGIILPERMQADP
jgi:ERCC4-related helicase